MSKKDWLGRSSTEILQQAYDRALEQIADCARESGETLILQSLAQVPPEIGQLVNLEELSIIKNQELKTLPREIGLLKNLKKLFIFENSLETVPEEIGMLANLEELVIRGNSRLKALPRTIGRLENLTLLFTADGALASLPREIGQLSNLTVLDFGNNRLSTLPSELGQLSRLQSLGLCTNDLAALPPEIGRLARLESLFLEDNLLRELPGSLTELSRLKKLTLHGNNALRLPLELLGPTRKTMSESKWTVPPANPHAILDYYFSHHRDQPRLQPELAQPPADFRPRPSGKNPPPNDALRYDVFISAKSEDYEYARNTAKYLREAGLQVFFSEQNLKELGNSDYFDAIDTALEYSSHLLVVTSSRSNVTSQWVKKEWQTYLNEKLAGRKTGNVVSLLCGSMGIGDLPLSLRGHEARPMNDLPSLLSYFKSREH